MFLLQLLTAECVDHPDRLESLLHYADDVAFAAPDFARGLLDGLPEAHHEEEKEGGHAYRDEREIPVEPEHQAEHSRDRE